MKVGDCPSCRAPVEFLPGAARIKVCEYCHTVVYRGEVNLEARGKVADLVDTNSPLKLRLSGRYGGTPFTVQGRVQKSLGVGVWDEWFLAFEDGREAWLAESEGDWKLLFPLADAELPALASLRVLGAFTLREKKFVVEEKRTASTVTAEGQLPAFHQAHAYVDATGPRGVFCTLDEADGETEAFIGNVVTLGQLGFDEHELQPTPKREALRQARCTQCNGMLDLKAPDAARRVACPYCGALLSVEHGDLRFLQTLEKPPHEPKIPLGAVGRLVEPGADAKQPPSEWTCLAFLIRSCTVEGTRYPWEEYLLWNRTRGFRWLMNSNGHWTWLAPIAAGEVELKFRDAKLGTEHFRAYQTVFATTEYVVGECYWEVNAGEVAEASEFIAPPRSLNIDQTAEEATLTLGTLLEGDVVKKAFSLKQPLPAAFGIAPAQENPFSKKSSAAWTWSLVWGGALIALMVVFSAIGTTETYYQGRFSVPPNAAPASPEAQRFSEPFEVKARVPLEVEVRAPGLTNNWLGVSIDLVNEATGEVIEVYAEPSSYSGVEDGESWSEGNRDVSKSTDVVDKGRYVLRATPHFEATRAVDYEVKVSADDGSGVCCPVFFILCLLVAPLYYSLRASGFETRKWNDAVFQSAPGVSTFPYAKDEGDDE